MTVGISYAVSIREGQWDGETVGLLVFKYGHIGVRIQSRRGDGPREFLAIDTESPCDDARPRLNPARPEVREYRMRFRDKGSPHGVWTGLARANVSP